MIYKHIEDVPETSECNCRVCQNMCTRPCWVRPSEALELMQRGLGDRLCTAKWFRWSGPATEVLMCALKGDEGGYRNDFDLSERTCTFFHHGKCELHGVCKPLEGRTAHHEENHSVKISRGRGKKRVSVHEAIRDEWETPWGREVLRQWETRHEQN